MNEPPTWHVDRGAWVFYVGAGLTAALALGLLLLGQWPAMFVALGLAAWVGGHPYIRREWFVVGYTDGYIDGATDERRRTS